MNPICIAGYLATLWISSLLRLSRTFNRDKKKQEEEPEGVTLRILGQYSESLVSGAKLLMLDMRWTDCEKGNEDVSRGPSWTMKECGARKGGLYSCSGT